MSDARLNSLLEYNPDWLIIDAAGCPEPFWYAKGLTRPLGCLFDYRDEELVEKGPWIIDAREQVELWQQVIEQDQFGYASLWMKSTLGLDELKQQLSYRLYSVLPSGETTRFRFYDPRVLHHYLNAETPELRDEFLSPVYSILYADLNPFKFHKRWQMWHSEEHGYVSSHPDIEGVN